MVDFQRHVFKICFDFFLAVIEADRDINKINFLRNFWLRRRSLTFSIPILYSRSWRPSNGWLNLSDKPFPDYP